MSDKSNKNDYGRVLFDSHPDGVYLITTSGVFVDGNPQAERITGYKKEELIGKSVFKSKLVHKNQFGRIAKMLAEIAMGRSLKSEEITLIRKDKSTVEIEISTHMIQLEGKTYILGSARDISERHLAQRALEDSEAKFRAIVENAQPVIFVIDKQGKFVLSEGASLARLSLKPGQVVGKSAFEMYKDYPQIIASIKKALKGEVVHEYLDMGFAHFDTTYSPQRNATGQVTGIIGLATDITELKEVERDLVKAREQAEESDRLKSAFIANISHEIRTPLNSIIGFSELLCEDDLDQDQKNTYFDIIRSGGDHLLSMIEMVLDISIIESGMMKLNKEQVDLTKLIQDLADQFNQIRSDSPMRCIVEVNEPLVINTDRNRIIQVLNNLISNAFKYAGRGEIVISYQVSATHVTFSVKDQGTGISEQFKDKIFDRFYRAPRSEKIIKGTGLGLAICKAIVEAMQGKIWYESEPDKGTIFYFNLPNS